MCSANSTVCLHYRMNVLWGQHWLWKCGKCIKQFWLVLKNGNNTEPCNYLIGKSWTSCNKHKLQVRLTEKITKNWKIVFKVLNFYFRENKKLYKQHLVLLILFNKFSKFILVFFFWIFRLIFSFLDFCFCHFGFLTTFMWVSTTFSGFIFVSRRPAFSLEYFFFGFYGFFCLFR